MGNSFDTKRLFKLVRKLIFASFVEVGVLPVLCYAMGSEVNFGHRVAAGSGEYNSHLPENSIVALKAALLGVGSDTVIQDHKDFNYLEFDVRETYDNKLVLFHDVNPRKLMPNNGSNRRAYRDILRDPMTAKRHGKANPSIRDLEIRHMTFAQLQSLSLGKGKGEKVPTLENFLEKAKQWGLRKPLAAEIKDIHSDYGRREYLRLVNSFAEEYYSRVGFVKTRDYKMDDRGANILSFPSHFHRSFGDEGSALKRSWCRHIYQLGFGAVYQAFKHENNLCSE